MSKLVSFTSDFIFLVIFSWHNKQNIRVMYNVALYLTFLATTSEESKYQGLENLDVGSKFKMFEKGLDDSEDGLDSPRMTTSTDRYGIMEKLKRLQEGDADLDDLLAEIDEEIPSDKEEEEDSDEIGMTLVQKKVGK